MSPDAESESPTTEVVDTEVGGDILRIVLKGVPRLAARSSSQAFTELRHDHEAFRRFLLEAPHGHAGLNACLVLPPLAAACDRTVVLAAQFGYAPMAGTALMAAAAVLHEFDPRTAGQDGSRFTFDTAIGPGRVEIRPATPRAPQARWLTSPPSVLVRSQALSLPNGGRTRATLVDSGLPYAVAELHDPALEGLDRASLARIGGALARAASATCPPAAVGSAFTTPEYIALLVGTPGNESNQGKPEVVVPVAWVSASGIVAEGPGGTGALAVAAHLRAEHRLTIDTGIRAVGPSGAGLRCRIGDGEAEVTADVRIRGHRFLPAPPLEAPAR